MLVISDLRKAGSRGVTALFVAAQEGHEAIVQLLCKAGAAKGRALSHIQTRVGRAGLRGNGAGVQLL